MPDQSTERKNITQPADWWAAFVEQAKKEGMSLSEWLGEIGKEKLPKKTLAKLSQRPKEGRRKNPENNS